MYVSGASEDGVYSIGLYIGKGKPTKSLRVAADLSRRSDDREDD